MVPVQTMNSLELLQIRPHRSHHAHLSHQGNQNFLENLGYQQSQDYPTNKQTNKKEQ